MTTTYIERDALASTPEQPPPDAHQHDMKSFIATPRTDASILERIRSIFTDELKPGILVTRKDADGLRHMFIITSNAYEDRESETITSAALKAYEDSCYPGDDLFHCDNPLLWFHDDDVPIGEIVAVNYSDPFLVEVARELNDPVAKVLWDYAEQNGDKAGASHRFGYRDEDRLPNGDYKRIFKQETTYLPDRALAANLGTYAGVLKEMSTVESDKRLNVIFEQATGIKDAASKIHAKSGALKKELAELGIMSKAAPPVVADDTAAAEVDAETDTEAKAEAPGDFAKYLETLNQIYALVMSMVDAQSGMYDAEMGMMKALKAQEDARVKDKAYNDTLEKRVAMVESRLNMSGRSVTQQRDTNAEALTKAAKDLVDGVEKDGTSKVWGFEAAPPIDYTSVTGK